jgi:VanZ family protein
MVFKYYIPVVLWTVMILILTLLPGNAVPDVPVFGIDKLVHVFIFGMLMYLTCYAIAKSRNQPVTRTTGLLIAAAYSIILSVGIEILQNYVPGRSFSYADIVANITGIVLGYWIFRIYYQAYQKSAQK